VKEFGKTSGVVRIPWLQVTLQSDGMQRHAGMLEFVDQLQQSLAHRKADVIVALALRLVENQFRLPVHHRHSLEGPPHIARAERVVPWT
jgi:hypothetical protein